jgi:2',3'-cyclic-nucleotide 2'-phosphodiesterase (5'-nucleotidase family)
LMPFENELVFVKLTGQQVRELANYIVIREGEGVAGISFGMKNNMAVDIKVQELMIDNAKSYWMATSDYIANGGDGMKVLTWAEERIDTGHKMRDIMIEQMKELHKSGKKLHAKSDGRLYHAK